MEKRPFVVSGSRTKVTCRQNWLFHRNTWSSDKTSIDVPVKPEITQTITLH